MKPHKVTTTVFHVSAFLFLMALFALSVSAQDNDKSLTGSRSQSDMNSKPHLEVNGKRIEPIAGSKMDLLINVPSGGHTWTLLKENTSSKDINQFGFYSDIGVGRNRVPIFLGPDSLKSTQQIIATKPTEYGLWLLNDQNNDSIFSDGEALLYSERFLTVGAEKPQHQYFMVYDVSEFKGTGAKYEFETKGSEEFKTRGDFDFLIFADDSRVPKKFDHDDMIIGLLLGDGGNGGGRPPFVSCPSDTSIIACDEISPICLRGFRYLDPDHDIAEVKLIGATFQSGQVCFVPHIGQNRITLIVTDSTGLSDSCSVNIDVTLNSAPTVTSADDFSVTQCVPEEVCFGIAVADPDNDDVEIDVNIGSYDAYTGQVCFMPEGSGQAVVIVTAIDSCGLTAVDTTIVRVDLNSPPVIEDQSFSATLHNKRRRLEFPASDPDGDILRFRLLQGVGIAGRSRSGGGFIGYTPDTSGVYSFVVEVNDSCATDTALILDSVTILLPVTIQYVTNSLNPEQAPAGGLVQFSFDIDMVGADLLLFSSEHSTLQIHGNIFRSFFVNVGLQISDNTLKEGVTRIRSDQVFIPERLLGDSLSLFLSLLAQAPGASDYVPFRSSFDTLHIPVVQMPLVRIVDVANISPNSPKVNIGQSFTIACRVANLTALATPAFDLRMVTDGNSVFDSLLAVPPISPFDTATVSFNVVAGVDSNPLELFHVHVAEQIVGEAPSVNNFAPAFIQSPALLRLEHTLVGARFGVIEPGQDFALMVRLLNDGESETTIGRFSLGSNGVDLGVEDPIISDIALDTTLTIHFTAPSVDTTFSLSFAMTELPLDMNTNLPAQFESSSFAIPLRVMTQAGDLVVSAKAVGPNVITTGNVQDLFELTLTNVDGGASSDIAVNEITLSLRPNANRPIDLTRFLDLSRTGFVRAGNLISTAEVDGELLRLNFSDMTIPSSATAVIQFQLSMREREREDFTLILNTDDIAALFSNGPFVGDSARVVSSGGSNELFNQQYATIGNNLQSSFEIENNPFNPLEGAANFAYFLTQPGDIEFRVFSLIGEEVYAMDLTEGMAGTEPNVRQLISWSGLSNDGAMVHNGVYVAMILQKSSGQKATIKVAVLK